MAVRPVEIHPITSCAARTTPPRWGGPQWCTTSARSSSHGVAERARLVHLLRASNAALRSSTKLRHDGRQVTGPSGSRSSSMRSRCCEKRFWNWARRRPLYSLARASESLRSCFGSAIFSAAAPFGRARSMRPRGFQRLDEGTLRRGGARLPACEQARQLRAEVRATRCLPPSRSRPCGPGQDLGQHLVAPPLSRRPLRVRGWLGVCLVRSVRSAAGADQSREL